MAIYELRTYTFQVGKLDQAKTLYVEKGWPALKKYQDKLVGYFVSDVGPLNQLVHLWRFEDDADRIGTLFLGIAISWSSQVNCVHSR